MGIKGFKQCYLGHFYEEKYDLCTECKDKRCECGKVFNGNFDLCPYCQWKEDYPELKGYEEENIKEYYSNGKLKMTGTIHYTKCTGWGGPFDCRLTGGGCVECFPNHSFPKWREGVWKIYDKTGKLSDKITYKNGEIV